MNPPETVAPAFGLECLCMAAAIAEGQDEPCDERKQKPLPEQGLASICRWLASDDASSGGGTRTPDTRIMIPPAIAKKAGKNADLGPSAARGAAVGAENGQGTGDALSGRVGQASAPTASGDADLGEVVGRWASLPEAIRVGILALVRAAK
jgi:hypothetical protein